MEGIGVVNVYDVDAANDAESDGGGAGTDDGEGDSDGDSEDEGSRQARRAGYRPLVSSWAEHPPPVVDDVAIQSPSMEESKEESNAVPSSNAIHMDEEKITQIKQAMASFRLDNAPQWASTVGDKELSEIVGQLKKAEKRLISE